jgi:DNA-binding Xre family transcriptional regulator
LTVIGDHTSFGRGLGDALVGDSGAFSTFFLHYTEGSPEFLLVFYLDYERVMIKLHLVRMAAIHRLMEVDMDRLKALRASKVLTLQELSDESGVTLNTIWRIESGYNKSARPSTIRKLASALGVEPSELVKAS